MAAVRQNGRALRDAAPELQATKQIVLEAVRQTGRALYHASEELRADKEVVLAAVGQTGMSLRDANADLRADKRVVQVPGRRGEGCEEAGVSTTHEGIATSTSVHCANLGQEPGNPTLNRARNVSRLLLKLLEYFEYSSTLSTLLQPRLVQPIL